MPPELKNLPRKDDRLIRATMKGVRTNAEVFVIDELEKVEERIDTVESEVKEKTEALEVKIEETKKELIESIPDLEKVLESVRGTQGIQGEKGDAPTEEELIALIDPLIPAPVVGPQGVPGKDSVVPGPKGEKGDPGKDAINGIDGKDADPKAVLELVEQRIPELAEKFRDGLELLQGKERLSIKAIDGFDEWEKAIKETTTQGRARAGWGAHPLLIQDSGSVVDKVARIINFGSNLTVTRSADGIVTVTGSAGGGLTELTATGTINGVNADFTFTEQPDYIFSDGVKYKVNAGWSWNGGTLTATMSIPPSFSIWGET